MAEGDELLAFVRDALGRGVPRAQIEDALRRSGWTTDQIRGALTAYAEIDFPIPVPRARPYLSAREAFIYLVLFGTLYAVAFNLGSLIFDFINIAFPDAAQLSFDGYPQYVRESIRWSISWLIVAFPVFLYLSWLTERDVGRDPVKRASKVRRWLTYLTLFSAACALLGDFATLVYNVLGGELTVRFLLKVVTVALIAGRAFIYYLRDLRQDEVGGVMAMSGKRLLAVVLTIVVAAAVVTGIVIIGSPMEERTRRLDTRRVQDLQQISQSVQVYHSRHQRTPASLDELSKEPGLARVPRDPVNGEPYRYLSVDSDSYELCGTFDRESDTRTASFWSHGAGTQCFTLNVKQTTVP